MYLADSSDARFRSFEIGGNSKQETRSGKNKLDLSKISQKTLNGVTCTYNAEEKSVTLNGTCTTDNTGFAISSDAVAIKTLVKDKTTLTAYYVSGECSGTGTTSVQAHATGYVSNVPITDLSNLKDLKIRTATYASTNYPNAELYIVNIRVNEGAVLDNFTFKLMLTEDVDTEYEEYGAMPSLEFPSNVEAVGQDVNIFNGELETGSYNTATGAKTTNNSMVRNTELINVEGIKEIIASNDGIGIALNLFEYDKNSNFLKYTVVSANNSLVLQEDTAYINFHRGNTQVDKIKIQEGNKITRWSPYNCGSANVVVENKNRFIPELIKYITQSRTNVTLEDDVFVFECTGTDMYLGNIASTGQKYFEGCGKLINVKDLTTISVKLTNELFKKNFLSCFDKNLISLGIKQFSSDILNNYTLPEGTEYVTLRFGIASSTAGTIYKTQVQIEEGDTTDYVAHEEQNFTMPVQQEMLEGDEFDWNNEEEVHTWGKVELKGTENIALNNNNNKSIFYFDIPGQKTSKEQLKSNTYIYSTASWQLIEDKQITNEDGNVAIFIREDEVKNTIDFKTKLQELYNAEKPLTIYYKLAEPTKLPFTEAQKTVAKQIREKLHSYKGGTHVYSVDEISPIFNVRYTKDLNAVINNLSQQAIEGGN